MSRPENSAGESRLILVTGGAGFIGSNFIRLVLKETVHRIVNLDLLTYAGNLENLADLQAEHRYSFVKGDIADATLVEKLFAAHSVEWVVNFAAESHVDRSIMDASAFIRTNIQGTQVLLDAARRHGVTRFLQVSTDEVYGSLGTEGRFTETTPLAPNSPYSASKTAADLLCRAAFHTHQQPVLVTRCSNNYGPYQFPEKLIPLMISNALENKPLPVYGKGENVRDWIHVEDHVRALLTVLERGVPGEVYNVGGGNEWRNIDIVKLILRLLERSEELITFVRDRPGHDFRYAIDSGKLKKELGWQPGITFAEGMEKTIQWYLEHQEWLKNIKSGTYREYYQRWYGI